VFGNVANVPIGIVIQVPDYVGMDHSRAYSINWRSTFCILQQWCQRDNLSVALAVDVDARSAEWNVIGLSTGP
jgi:hypothetical protein